MIRTQIHLSEEQLHALRELAASEQVSAAELIRQAVDHWLNTMSPVPIDERREQALAIVGRFHSGLSDVSERHDAYLADAYSQW